MPRVPRGRKKGHRSIRRGNDAGSAPDGVSLQGLSAALALLRHGRLLVLGDFPRAELRDACNQLHGDGLGEREADRAFADLIRGKVVVPTDN
jgi:hypothetical protein